MPSHDCVVAVHIGHDLIRESEVAEYLERNDGSFNDWCCGGSNLFEYCPDCGKKLNWGVIIDRLKRDKNA